MPHKTAPSARNCLGVPFGFPVLSHAEMRSNRGYPTKGFEVGAEALASLTVLARLNESDAGRVLWPPGIIMRCRAEFEEMEAAATTSIILACVKACDKVGSRNERVTRERQSFFK